MSDPAVIYIPAGSDLNRWQHETLAHVKHCGYELVSLVIDDDWPNGWANVQGLLDAGLAEVVVVARREHLPPDRAPRHEVAGDEPAQAPRQRRPRRVKPHGDR